MWQNFATSASGSVLPEQGNDPFRRGFPAAVAVAVAAVPSPIKFYLVLYIPIVSL